MTTHQLQEKEIRMMRECHVTRTGSCNDLRLIALKTLSPKSHPPIHFFLPHRWLLLGIISLAMSDVLAARFNYSLQIMRQDRKYVQF